jgi:foldase protein PrsA
VRRRPSPRPIADCIKQKRKTTPKPAKGQPKVTDSQLKTQCKQEYNSLRDQVMQLLVSFEWIEGEAKAKNIKVSDKEVKASFDKQKKQAFPKAADFDKFLKDSGQTEGDILKRVRLDTLSNKIREKVTKGKDKVTDAQIAAFYNKNKARFAQPERRDLRIVLTKDKAKAEKAKKAIESGQSFKSVAKKYSIDQASKAQGGKLPAVAKGQQEKALDTAIFAADKGKLVGPVKTQFGYYVFEVTKITKATQQTLDQAKATIKQTLASQNQQKALDSFVKSFRKRWKAKTDCRDAYRTQDCKNAPKATPTPTATAPAARSRPAHRDADAEELSDPTDSAAAVERLDALTRRLRVECPWDREQDERSIVPHTVEEAYELAAAAIRATTPSCSTSSATCSSRSTSWRCCSRSAGAGSFADVAEHVRQKLIRRHPHIFGEVEVEGAARCCATGTRSSARSPGREPGIFGEVPENLPGPLYARKVQRRAASSGFDFEHVPYDAVEGELEELREAEGDREASFHEVGDVLFAAVNVARKLKVDPELALRAASERFRGRVQTAADLAARAGADWNDLGPNAQLGYYAQARLAEQQGDSE